MKKERWISTLFTAAALCLMSAFPVTSYADTDRWISTVSRDEDGDICVDFAEVQVLLPADWSGKCQMASSDDSVSFYQTKSRQRYTEEPGYPNGGWLFSVCFSEALDFLDHPAYQPLAQVDDGYYYMTFPTDVQGYMDDEEVGAEFSAMSEEVAWVTANTTVTNGRAYATDYPGEPDYILSQSSTEYLQESDLSGMDSAQVQMAINEIYARHHRKFVLTDVQDYFNSKSWYEGLVEPDAFNVNVMNAYEGANIDLMVNYMKKLAQGEQTITIEPSQETKDLYGMIIESGSGYIRVRQQDGSVIQLWYDASTLQDLGISESKLSVGAVISAIYDAESYEMTHVLIW